MSASLTEGARVTARAVATTGTARRFDVSAGGKRAAVEWDPRDTGTTCLLEASVWDEPSGAPLAGDEERALAEAVLAAGRSAGGVRSVLAYRASLGTHEALAWDRGADGHLARVVVDAYPYPERAGRGAVHLLSLGRTLAVPFEAVLPTDDAGQATYGAMRATLRPDAAQWLLPEPAPLDPAAWPALRAWLASAAPHDFFLTSDYPVFSDPAGSL